MGKKHFLCSLFSILFLCSFAFSQTSQEENKPLIDLLEILENRYKVSFSYADETILDVHAIEPIEELSLAEALNYLQQQTGLIFTVLSSNLVTITKSQNEDKTGFTLQELQEVVVSSYLTKGISQNNNGSITLKPNQFGILPGLIEPDVLQTIQALPGIVSVDETISNINIRGGTHDQNLILWDGIKMYQSGHFFGLISAFNPYLTQQVDVSKNGTSVKYGDGVSGIIDMQNANEIQQIFEAGLGLNLINADGFVKTSLAKNIELQLSARRSVTDLLTTPTYNQYFDRVFQDTDLTNNQDNTNNTVSKDERFYFYDISAKLLFDISSKDKVRLNFLYIDNNIDYQEQSTVNNIEAASNSNLNQNNIAGGFQYTRIWSPRLVSNLQAYATKYDLHAINYDVINDQRLNQENKVIEYAIKFDTSYELSNNFKLNSGYQLFETGISNFEDVNNPEFRSFIKKVLLTHAGFSELKFLSNNSQTHIKAGARVNYFDKFNKLLIEPRLSFSQRFLSHFRVELLGELKSQSTSQIIDLQRDFLGIEKRRWILSNNEDIPIIQSQQASLGLHYTQNNWLVSAEGYYKKVEGITSRSQGFQNQFQFVNDIGEYTVTGLDLLINKRFTNSSTWLSYSFSDNNYTFTTLNNGVEFPNNVNITHAVSFGITHNIKQLKLAAGVNWHTGKPFTTTNSEQPISGNDIIYNTPNSENLTDYFRADVSATYTFKLGEKTNAVAGISLWNVTNQKNILNSYYKLENDEVLRVNNISLGLTPNASFRLSF